MSKPKRIQWTRKDVLAGKKLEPGAMLVTRPSRYGNPYPVDTYGREEALRLYRIYLEEKVKNGWPDLARLKGKNLACACELHEACHADILLEMANR